MSELRFQSCNACAVVTVALRLLVLASGLLAIPGHAENCRLGFAPQNTRGVELAAGQAQTFNLAGIQSVKNIGRQPLTVTLSFAGRAEQLALPAGRRAPANPRLSFNADTVLIAAQCSAALPTVTDLLPLSHAPAGVPAVFRVDTDAPQSVVTGIRNQQPIYAPFYRVYPDALCQGIAPPGLLPAGPKLSAPRTVKLADYHWGVQAVGQPPTTAIAIRLSGGYDQPAQLLVQPDQFRQVSPGRYQAVFRSPRSQRQVSVFRVGRDPQSCWTHSEQASLVNDRDRLVVVDVDNRVTEAREDNNQKPYGAKP